MDDGTAHAVVEVDGVLAEAHEAARVLFARDGYFDIAHAVLDGHGAVEVADESASASMRGMRFRVVAGVSGVDVAGDGEVEEHGITTGTDEGCYKLCIDRIIGGSVVDGQCVALAVECAIELVVLVTRHAGDGDVRAQFHGLAAERLAACDGIAEEAPACGGEDGVFIVAGLRKVTENSNIVNTNPFVVLIG